MLKTALRVNACLFFAVVFLFPILKVAQTFRRMPLPNPPPIGMRNPSTNEVFKLGVEKIEDWSYTDQIGYGLLRRFDDSNFWLLIGLLLANQYVLQLGCNSKWAVAFTGIRTNWLWRIFFGVCFALLYLWVVWIEKGTFFSGHPAATPRYETLRDWAIQYVEGFLNVVIFSMSGICIRFYWEAVSDNPTSQATLERISQIGYTPILIVTLFTAAVEFVGAELDTADRKSLVVVQLTVIGGAYLFVLARAKVRLSHRGLP